MKDNKTYIILEGVMDDTISKPEIHTISLEKLRNMEKPFNPKEFGFIKDENSTQCIYRKYLKNCGMYCVLLHFRGDLWNVSLLFSNDIVCGGLPLNFPDQDFARAFFKNLNVFNEA